MKVWVGFCLVMIFALVVGGAGHRPTSFTIIIPTAQVMRMDRSVWSSTTVRPIYRLQKVTVNGQTNCLEAQDLGSGYVNSVVWEPTRVQVKVTTDASLNPGDALLWVFSTTPNQPRIVVPFSQEGAASQIDYPQLMSAPYCP
ncbi:hypothetical protein KBD61_04215 [Patescibacteria group bacterium]|nr:hypothetical protein [Patescibacteria group bacterium]